MIINEASKNNIDVPGSLIKFFNARDSNTIFEYLKHLKQDTLRNGIL